MNDNTATVRIIADASGVASGVNQAKTELQAMGPVLAALNASIAKLTAEMKSGFAGGAGSAEKMTAALHGTKAATEQETLSLGMMVGKIHEAAESVRTFQMRAKEFAEVYVAAFAVEQIGEFAKKMAESAEHIHHLSEQFGLTTGEVQQLQVVGDATGVSMDAIARGMGLLDKNMITAAGSGSALGNALKSVGLTAIDGKTQIELMLTVADKFKDMDNGPKKAALAMMLFGKSGKELIPVLNLGSEGIRSIRDESFAYGAASKVAGDFADLSAKKGLALAESLNEQKIAFKGVGNVVTDAFAPVLKEATDGINKMVLAFVKSYREGGTVKIIFTTMTNALEFLGNAITVVSDVLSPLSDFIKLLWQNAEISVPIIGALAALLAGKFVLSLGEALVATLTQSAAMGTLVAAFAMDGVIGGFITLIKASTTAMWEFTAALLANPLTWVALLIAAVGSALAYLAMHTRTTSDAFKVMGDVIGIAFESIKLYITLAAGTLVWFGKIADEAVHLKWGEVRATWHNGLAGIVDEVKKAGDKIKALQADIMQHMVFGGGAAPKPKAEAAPRPGSFDPELGKTTKEKTPKKGPAGPGDIEKFKLELEQQLLMEKNYGVDVIDFTLKFWQQKLAIVKGKAKESLVVETEIDKLKLAQFKQVRKAEIDALKETEALKLIAAKSDGAAARAGIEAKITAVNELAQLGTISGVRAAQERQKLNADLLKLDKDLAVAEYNLKLDTLTHELDLIHQTPQEYSAVLTKIRELKATHEAWMRGEDDKTAANSIADSNKVLNAKRAEFQGVADAWGASIGKMVTAQQGFWSTVSQMWGSLVSFIEQKIAKKVAAWITGEVVQTGASAAGNLTRTGLEASSATTSIAISAGAALAKIAHHAAVAFAGAYAAISAIPFIGPALAPIAAAAAFAGVIMIGKSVLSAEGGMGNVPYDNAPFLLHKNEMVLPASIASPLRGALSSGSFAPQAANDQGGSSDFHYHDHTQQGLTESQIMANRGAFAKAIDRAHREGAFAGSMSFR
jgi:hypothetical protein